MIALASRIADLAKRRAVARFPLVVMTTFSDADAGTVSRTFYWSTKPARYKYAASATPREFLPILQNVGAITSGFAHVPDAAVVESRRAEVRLELIQEDRGSGVVWKDLSAETLQFARVEIADLLVDADRIARGAGTAWWDLTDYAGTEHVVRFRGEFIQVEEVTDQGVTLVFQVSEPNLNLARADQASSGSGSLGSVYPLPFGQAKNVRCVRQDVGWATTISVALTNSATGNKDVADASNFPASGSFTVVIGTEQMTVSRVDFQTLNITARGANGTSAVAHSAGDSLSEVLTNVIFVAAGYAAKALPRLYVIKPSTDERVLVPSGSYTLNLANAALVAGVTLTTIAFSAAQYATLKLLAGPSGGQPLSLEADIDGAAVPSGFSYASGYDFADSSWSTLDASVVDTGPDIQITPASDALLADGSTVIGGCESLTGWTTGNGTITLDTSVKSSGSSSFKMVSSSGGSAPRLRWAFTTHPNVNGRTLAMDIRGNGLFKIHLTSIGSPDPGDGTTGHAYWLFVGVSGVFTTVYLDFDSFSGVAFDNGFDETDLRNLQIEANYNQSPGPTTSWVDNIRFVTKTARAAHEFASPGIDLTTAPNHFQVHLTATNVSNIAEVRIVLAETIISGVRVENTYGSFRHIVVPGYLLSEGTQSNIEVNIPGTPFPPTTLDAVRHLQVQVMMFTPGDGSVVTMHGLDVATAATTTWAGLAAGDLIEQGPDVIRFFLEVICGLVVETSSFATARTNLAGVVFAGSYEALGIDFGTIVASLEYETRTNVVRVETPSGSQYRALNASFADSIYSFPTAGAELRELRNIRESLKASLESPSRFAIHYSPDSGQASGAGRSFLGLLRASIDVNDFVGTPDWVLNASLSASEQALGRRDAQPVFLLASRAMETAREVSAYYIHEALRFRSRRWGFTVPLWEAYDAEPGDVVSFTPRWRVGPAKARVVQVALQLSEPLVGLVLEEVL